MYDTRVYFSPRRNDDVVWLHFVLVAYLRPRDYERSKYRLEFHHLAITYRHRVAYLHLIELLVVYVNKRSTPRQRVFCGLDPSGSGSTLGWD